MSKAAEEAHEKWFAQHQIECERDLVVGATVYRPTWDSVEEGVVRRVARCNNSKFGGGSPIEAENGEHPYYVAEFASEWVGQIYQWKFFATEAGARKQLVHEIHHRIADHRRDIQKWEALISALEALTAAQVAATARAVARSADVTG